jgi:hypothetical protein
MNIPLLKFESLDILLGVESNTMMRQQTFSNKEHAKSHLKGPFLILLVNLVNLSCNFLPFPVDQ